jgi:hypothetical protein
MCDAVAAEQQSTVSDHTYRTSGLAVQNDTPIYLYVTAPASQ